MLNVTKKPFKFPWKFCPCRHAWINQWFYNKSCLLWWPVSLSITIQTTLNHIRFFFLFHNIKNNERNLCQDLLTIENTDSDLKVHALHYANELLVRVQATKTHFDLFLPAMNVKENVFFFRARVQKGIAWHIDASSVVWTLINNGKLW